MRDVEVRELARKELKISKDSSNRFYKEELERIMKERGIIKQEFPSQKFLYFERCQDGYIEYNIPTNTKIRMVLDKIEFEIEQARAEMIKEIERIVDEYFKSQFPEDTGLRDAIIDKIKQLEKEENK